MMSIHAVVVAVALTALTGCSSVRPGAGFEDVQRRVAERAGARIQWDTGSAADARVREAVDSLLAHPLDADDAVQVALLNNRGLLAVYEDLSLAQADVVQAGLLTNPVFSAEARFSTSGGGTGIDMGIAQGFVGLLRMPLLKSRAGAAFEAATLRVTGVVLDTAFDVRRAFYRYQAAEQMREMYATALAATGASYELAERIHDAGNSTDLDLANERALHEQARLDLSEAEADAARARERLNALMGLWGSRIGWRAEPRLPALPERVEPVDGLERRAIGASLDLAVLRRRAEVAARSAGIAGPFGWLDGSEVGVAAEREAEGDWSVGPALSLPIPLFDQGQARSAAAGALFRQTAQWTMARAVEIRSGVRAAHADVVFAHDRARYYERVILPLRRKIVEETHLQYNAMQVSPFQLLNAKREQIIAGAGFIEALHDYWASRADLDQLLGGRPARGGQASDGASITPGAPGDFDEGGPR